MSHTTFSHLHIGSRPRPSHFSLHPIHACARGCLSVLFIQSLYFFLKSFFHLFLIPAMVPDENSMEDPLCNSSFGSMVSLDYVTPDTLPVHCVSKVERLKTGEMLYERRYLSPRRPPKISLKHDHNWTKGNDQGSTVEHQPVGKLVQQSSGEASRAESSKPTQSKLNPICDRTVKPVETERVSLDHSQEIVGKRLQEKLGSSDRTGKPLKCENNRVMNVHDRTRKPVESSTNTYCARIWFSRTS